MSLEPITRNRDFFSECLSRAEIAPEKFNHEFGKTGDERHHKIIIACQQDPKLLFSAPSNYAFTPFIHDLARGKSAENRIAYCVQLVGQAVLEVGNNEGDTPIFETCGSYLALKRITDLGAQVNIRSIANPQSTRQQKDAGDPPASVLELHVEMGWKGKERRRCIKHLLRLGACIQENTPLSAPGCVQLLSIYQEFLIEISAVVEKIKRFHQVLQFPTPLETLILDYALGEEDSEKPVWDQQERYALDDETEAYALIKTDKMNRKIPLVLQAELEPLLPTVLKAIVISYAIVPTSQAFVNVLDPT
jgi:hypothetical protein